MGGSWSVLVAPHHVLQFVASPQEIRRCHANKSQGEEKDLIHFCYAPMQERLARF